MIQLKADLQHREKALKQQLGGVRERPDDGAGRGRKIQDGVHSMQREQSGKWGDLMEEGCKPEVYKASRVPQIRNPEGEEPIEKGRHQREEQDGQKQTNPKTARPGEESGTSSRTGDKNQTPWVQSAGGEGDEEATLARLLGMDATVVVMPQEQLTKIVKRNCRRTPRRRVAQARQQGGIPRATQQAGEMPQGERSPGSQPRNDPGQEEGSYSQGREAQQEQAVQANQTQGGYEQEGAHPRSGQQPQESCKERKRAWVVGSSEGRKQRK